MKIPAELKYTKTDEWVQIDGNVATIGISDYAQSQLSDIVYFEFKVDKGEAAVKDKVVATVESVKAAADVNAPLSGKVVELNEALNETFETINTDPFGVAWMLKVEITNPAELSQLMDAAAYEKYCQERSH